MEFGKEYLKDTPNAQLLVMDVHNLQFQDQELFDVILCLQNGLSAMKIEPVGFIWCVPFGKARTFVCQRKKEGCRYRKNDCESARKQNRTK